MVPEKFQDPFVKMLYFHVGGMLKTTNLNQFVQQYNFFSSWLTAKYLCTKLKQYLCFKSHKIETPFVIGSCGKTSTKLNNIFHLITVYVN